MCGFAAKFGNKFPQPLPYGGRSLVEHHAEFLQQRFDLRQIGRAMQGAEHLGVASLNPLLVVEVEFFKEFLSGPQPGVDDFDFVWFKARQADEISGQIDNFDAHSHIENKNLATRAHGGRLKHKLRGFRNHHEKPLDLRMGDGDRAAAADLLLKRRNDAPIAPEHISEPHHNEVGLGGSGQGLHVPLGDQF